MWRHEKLARQFKRNVATSAPFLFSAVPGFPRVLRAAVVFPFLWRKLHNDCIRTEADASSTTWFHIIFYRNSSKTSTHTFTYYWLQMWKPWAGRQSVAVTLSIRHYRCALIGQASRSGCDESNDTPSIKVAFTSRIVLKSTVYSSRA